MTSDYTQLARPERAQYITEAVSQWCKEYATRFAVLGLMLYDFESERLWEEVIDPATGWPFGTFGQWMARCAPGEAGEAEPPARSWAYAALKARKELLDIPAADYAQIREANVGTLLQLSTAVRRDPAVLEAARGNNPALIAHVKAHHKDQHIESPAKMLFNFTEGAKAEVEEAVQLAIERGDADNKESAVLGWAINYKDECRGRDEQRIMDSGKVAHA